MDGGRNSLEAGKFSYTTSHIEPETDFRTRRSEIPLRPQSQPQVKRIPSDEAS
jgi:hypothetical protein